MWIQKEETDGDEDEHRHELADRENVAGNRRLTHTQNIDAPSTR